VGKDGGIEGELKERERHWWHTKWKCALGWN